MALTLQGGVTKNAISGLSGAGSGALAGASAGPVGAIVGGLLGAGASLLGNLGNNRSTSAIDLNIQDLYNMEMYNTIKDLYFMNVQDNYNRNTMRYQTDLQRELQEQQFNHNRWFVENAYQNTVQDLRKAGLNPLLATQNGANMGSVSGGSASALGISVPSTGTDISSFLSASASSAQAKVAKEQLKINMLNGLTDIMSKYANSSLALQQAKTENNKRELLNSQTAINLVDEQQKKLDYELDKKYADKDRILQQKAVLAGIKNQTITSLASLIGANAGKTSAEANYINATTGSPVKLSSDFLKGLLGVDSAQEAGTVVRGYFDK